ncbi:MAG: hypothetical protein ABIK93_02150 [candidate division WOR-3 bacterium]
MLKLLNRFAPKYLWKGGRMLKDRFIFFAFLALLFLISFLTAQPVDTMFMPYEPDLEEVIDIDGTIEPDEYPESFYDEATLITVAWGCDDSLIYVGLKAPKCAWLAIGFGSPKREGSNLIIAKIAEDSIEIGNYLGTKEDYKLIGGEEDYIREWEIDEEEDTVTLEFIYPMNFPAESGMAITKLEHGKVYNFTLGMSKVMAPKGKQERRSFGIFEIEEKPVIKEPTPEESLPGKKEEKK